MCKTQLQPTSYNDTIQGEILLFDRLAISLNAITARVLLAPIVGFEPTQTFTSLSVFKTDLLNQLEYIGVYGLLLLSHNAWDGKGIEPIHRKSRDTASTLRLSRAYPCG